MEIFAMFDLYNDNFLRHPHHNFNPCYRKVISFTLHRFLREVGKEEAARSFNEMIISFKQQRLFEIHRFLEMYPTNMANGVGYVIVDSTGDGCFPLITRPDSRTQYQPRLNALFEVMRDLENQQFRILEIIGSQDSWPQIESRLEGIFNYSQGVNEAGFNQRDVG
jgi:hypothetical protein